MKKNIFKTIVCGFAALALTSCANNWLDTEPSNGVGANGALSTDEDLYNVRTGMYYMFKGSSSYYDYYGARMWYYADVRGEDMQSEPSGSRTKSLYNFTYRTASDAPAIWTTPYRLIRRASRIIEAVEGGNITGDAAWIAEMGAEAKVLRALAHFDLVRVYGQTYTADNGASYGVPIVTSALDITATPGRNTVAEVYTFVENELNAAINSGALSTDITTGYVNEWAAKAILARVYLTKGDNANALSLAEDIINNGPYELWANDEYAAAWSKKNGSHLKEPILEIVMTGTTDWVDREGIANLYQESGYADMIMTKTFLNLMSEDMNDCRWGVMVAPKTDDFIEKYGEDRVFLNKYLAMNTFNSLPVIRLSEMYLVAAEAAAKTSDATKAAKYLNAIVLRANPNATPVAEADATVARISKERRKELIGEGHRLFDAMRNNETITRYTSEADQGYHAALNEEARSFDRTFFKVLLPIPQGELDVNPTIAAQQNPGY
ncbi:MAG: RagB/SusD family nutrient uptake outer membrane protein [Bacteroidaceae bacterium]|nr:RagB/SusD family nutrient uptake outer membrane protein [Bacteroidaceae bacterium]